MTESEWLASGDWSALFSYSWETDLLTVRKVRLFAAAACRRFSHRLLDSRSWRAVEVCERCADGGVDADDEMYDARDNAGAAARSLSGVLRAAANSVCPLAYADPGKVSRATEMAPYVHAYEAAISAGLIPAERTLDYEDELRKHPIFLGGIATGERIQADLLREMIGNPFRSITLTRDRRTKTVVFLGW